MAETLEFTRGGAREQIYAEILPQIEALIEGETDVTANLANTAAALKEALDFFWVGFYQVKTNELVLGPFQGPVACTRIAKGQGVCGQAWQRAETIVVPDVDAFPGHIACSSDSKSEIVLPILTSVGEVWGVLDVDSDRSDDFDQKDVTGLRRVVRTLERNINRST